MKPYEVKVPYLPAKGRSVRRHTYTLRGARRVAERELERAWCPCGDLPRATIRKRGTVVQIVRGEEL